MFLHALEYGVIHPKSREKVLFICSPIARRVIKLCEFKYLEIRAIKIIFYEITI